jgi:hypothetical protein
MVQMLLIWIQWLKSLWRTPECSGSLTYVRVQIARICVLEDRAPACPGKQRWRFLKQLRVQELHNYPSPLWNIAYFFFFISLTSRHISFLLPEFCD